MRGSDLLARWRAALLADGHSLPALGVREGRILRANAAARTLFDQPVDGTTVETLFEAGSRSKVGTFLRDGRTGATTEAQVVHGAGPPCAVTLLLLDFPPEQLLLVTGGMAYSAEQENKLISTYAELANVAREVSIARECEHRRRAELEDIDRASRAVHEAAASVPQGDMSAVLSVIALQAQLLTRADYVALGIGTDESHPFDSWVFLGVSPQDAHAVGRFPRPVGLLGRVARDGETIRTDDLRRHVDFEGMPPGHPEMASFLGIPIWRQGRSVGNLYLANRPDGELFTEHDEILVRMLAARVAAAIETTTCYASESRERVWLQSVIDQMPDGVLLYDANGKVRTTNQSLMVLGCVEASGLDPFGNAVAVDLRTLEGEALPPDRWPIARVLGRHELVLREEMLVRCRNGELVSVAVSACPIRERGGAIAGAMMVIQDVSDRKKLERLREEWTAVVAHDLRQPVSTIGLATELLLRSPSRELTERDRRIVERIDCASKRLGRMIADLLDASRIESNRLAVVRKYVELRTYVGSVIDDLEGVLAGREVQLVMPTPETVCIDAERIHQVIGNLVSNAVKYGTPSSPLRIEAISHDDAVELVVTNHGPGITKEQLPLLFNRFTRLRDGGAGSVPGLGLGLYISKGLVEAHGGRLWVESTPGATTSFHFTLPRTDAAALSR